MTNEQTSIIAASSAALIHALGMYSENLQRLHRGESIMYDEQAFRNLASEHGIDYNNVVRVLYQ